MWDHGGGPLMDLMADYNFGQDGRDMHELDEALRQLPEKDRLVIHLFYYEGCSTREIAKLTRTTEGAVRTRLPRARQQLGRFLKGG